jgi:peptidoglycan/xylan/chitin deacetylase (PgdA/CDA1 family)
MAMRYLRRIVILILVLYMGISSIPGGYAYVVIGENSTTIPLEKRIYEALKMENLSDRIINIESLSYKNNVIVGVTFFYGIYYVGESDKIYRDLIDYSSRITKAIFQSFPSVSEIDLSAIYRDTEKVGDNYKEPTFTASIYRKDFESFHKEEPSFDLFLDKTGRVYYSDALLLEDPSALKRESYVEENSNRKIASPKKGLIARLRELWFLYRRVRVGGLHKNGIWRGNPHLKEIAITFDDGPRPVYTPIVLDILKRYSVKATFFVIGKKVQIYPYWGQDIVESGHTIGNHTMHHLNLTLLPYEKKVEEILNAQDTIYAVTGEKPRFFRPPGGDYDRDVTEILKKNSIYLVLWTKGLGDYNIPEKDAKFLLKKAEQDVVPGGIIVFHIGVRSTVDILPEFLEYVKREGYKIVSLEKLIEDSK